MNISAAVYNTKQNLTNLSKKYFNDVDDQIQKIKKHINTPFQYICNNDSLIAKEKTKINNELKKCFDSKNMDLLEKNISEIYKVCLRLVNCFINKTKIIFKIFFQ